MASVCLGRCQPLHHECGLAEPCRGRDQDKAWHRALIGAQLVGEAGARHQLAARRGQVQLGAQDRHSVSVELLLGPDAKLVAARVGEVESTTTREVVRPGDHCPAGLNHRSECPVQVG